MGGALGSLADQHQRAQVQTLAGKGCQAQSPTFSPDFYGLLAEQEEEHQTLHTPQMVVLAEYMFFLLRFSQPATAAPQI